MINIFERRRYLIILITILYFFGILEQIFNSKNILGFLANPFFQLSTIIYLFSVTFVVKLISSAKKIKKLSNEIISGEFTTDINLVNAKDSYDKATYEIIDSFSKELSKEKNSVSELENILANIKFGLMVIESKEDRIIYINNELKKIIEIPNTEQCLNKKYWEIILNNSFNDIVNLAKKNKSYVKDEINFGVIQDKTLLIRIGFINNDKDKILITINDVTENRQITKIKEELVLNVSHELRTPLSGIIGAIEYLNQNLKNEDKTINKMIDIILRNSNRLNEITQDLLSLSEIENKEKNGQLKRNVVDLREIIKNAEGIIFSTQKIKEVKISKNYQNAPIPFNGFANELEKIFTNILQNSLKFISNNGKIEINIKQNIDKIIIEIKDNGPGISPQDLEKIFERFYTVDHSRSKELSGTGLGLSIVKHAVNLHEGQIEALPSNDGAHFKITLPIVN
ncbi:ATP-binding protein [bacterium]|nr:ATP-binding protein [bacterium]